MEVVTLYFRRICNFNLAAILALVTLTCANGERILCMPLPQPSHVGEMIGATEQLSADYGHELYLVMYSRYRNPAQFEKKGYKVLTFEIPEDEEIDQEFLDKYITTTVLSGGSQMAIHAYSSHILPKLCEYMLADEEFVRKVRELKFDLAVIDDFVIGPCLIIASAYFNLPYVAVSSTFHPNMFRVPSLPSFATTTFSIEKSDPMSFVGRFKNTLWTLFLMNRYFGVSDKYLLKQYSPEHTSWSQLERKALLFICSRDHILEVPMPSMPNVLYLPGLTGKPAKPLTDEYRALVDSVKNGLIIMTFGSSFAELTTPIVQKFFSAFARLPDYTVIWRLRLNDEQKELLQVPTNVHLRDWLPQNDLLAHPRAHLFITHCGNGGQYEAVTHGVPMLGFPLFAEQHHNAARMEIKGIGKSMDILDFSSEELVQNLRDLLTNDAYIAQARQLSAILKDRRWSPQEESAYWINHVLKHGGRHLRSSGLTMPWYQYYLFDVMAVILVVLMFEAYIGYRILCRVFRWCSKGRKDKKA